MWQMMAMALLGFGLAAAPVQAQTAKQKSALSSLADAVLLDDRCESMTINPVSVGIVMTVNKIEAGDMGAGGKFASFVASRMLATSEKLKALNETGACALAEMTFGPKGMQIPGLMTSD